MSFHLELIGSQESSLNRAIRDRIASSGTMEAQRVTAAILRAIEVFPLDEANRLHPDPERKLALHVKADGHVDSNGWGQINISIRVIPASVLIPTEEDEGDG